MPGDLKLPPVTIHSHDKNDLVILATMASRAGTPDAQFLLSELRRASLCAVEAVPANVVSIGTCVTYKLGKTSVLATGTLVFPSDVNRFHDGLSVLTPLGTALLGLRVGASMPFRSTDGSASKVEVVCIGSSRAEDINSKSALDRRLDQALAQTFPASDPVSVICTS